MSLPNQVNELGGPLLLAVTSSHRSVLKGRPKSAAIRHERIRELSEPLLVSTSESLFDAAGNVVRTTAFDSDGRQQSREVFTYDEAGRLLETLHFEGVDTSAAWTKHCSYYPEDYEEFRLDRDGVIVETITAKNDSQGRVVDAKCIPLDGSGETRLSVIYNEIGFTGELFLPGWAESVILGSNAGVGNMIYGGVPANPYPGREEIESCDDVGNWTVRHVFLTDPNTAIERLEDSFYRTIVYY